VFLSIEVDAYAGNVRGHDGLQHRYAGLLRELAAQFEDFTGTPAHGLRARDAVSPDGRRGALRLPTAVPEPQPCPTHGRDGG
jgi:hypothetical protein